MYVFLALSKPITKFKRMKNERQDEMCNTTTKMLYYGDTISSQKKQNLLLTLLATKNFVDQCFMQKGVGFGDEKCIPSPF